MILSSNFQYSSKIVGNISEVSNIQGELSAKNFDFTSKKISHQQSLIESAHYSTKLEGNTLTLKQVTEVLAGESKVKKSIREIKEVVNYAKAQQFTINQKTKLNEVNLLKSHDILLSGILIKSMRGRYRKIQNMIKDLRSGNLVYLPPESKDVKGLMNDLFKLSRISRLSTPEVIIKSGLFHFHFESIHPFIDGNGRLGRLWSTNILLNGGLTFTEFSALEKYHEINRSQYYTELHNLQGEVFYNIPKNLDLTPWLEYWTDGLLFSAKEARQRMFDIPISNEETLLESRLVNAKKMFLTHKKLSAEQYQTLTQLGRTQAVEDLNKLIELKFIKKVGGGRSTIYLLAKSNK